MSATKSSPPSYQFEDINYYHNIFSSISYLTRWQWLPQLLLLPLFSLKTTTEHSIFFYLHYSLSITQSQYNNQAQHSLLLLFCFKVATEPRPFSVSSPCSQDKPLSATSPPSPQSQDSNWAPHIFLVPLFDLSFKTLTILQWPQSSPFRGPTQKKNSGHQLNCIVHTEMNQGRQVANRQDTFLSWQSNTISQFQSKIVCFSAPQTLDFTGLMFP